MIVNILKRTWRFVEEWVSPFMAAALISFLVVGLACAVFGVDREWMLAGATAPAVATGVLAIWIQPVRRWFVKHGHLFNVGSYWN